jgi:predicted transcriptional regulator
MKLKKARIIVESIEAVSERWAKALKGKVRSPKGVEIISIGSWEVLAKLLSPPRLQILTMIPQQKPKSIAHLARQLDRDFKNVHADVRFLADLGLIDLREEGARKTLVPIAKYSEIELPLVA